MMTIMIALCFHLQAILLCSGYNPLRCDVPQVYLTNYLNIFTIQVELFPNVVLDSCLIQKEQMKPIAFIVLFTMGLTIYVT